MEEQDRTIADLRAQNELFQTQLQHIKGSIKSSKSSASQSQKPQIIPKLQKKLSVGIHPSSMACKNCSTVYIEYFIVGGIARVSTTEEQLSKDERRLQAFVAAAN